LSISNYLDFSNGLFERGSLIVVNLDDDKTKKLQGFYKVGKVFIRIEYQSMN